jgi:hypothetical protein
MLDKKTGGSILNIKKLNPLVIWIVILGLIVVGALYYLFIRKPRRVEEITYAFEIDIPGRYIGEAVGKDGQVSTIAFEVNYDYQVVWLTYSDHRNQYQVKDVEWRFPHTLKAKETRYKTDGQGNLTGQQWHRRLHRQARTLIIESTRGHQKGPYIFKSDFLVDDDPGPLLLRPTADAQGIYAQFELKIPVIGQVPCPENYKELRFHGIPEEFQSKCNPPITFIKDQTAGVQEQQNKKVVPMAEGVFVEWYKNTVCQFSLDNDYLMAIDALFTPLDVIALLQNETEGDEYVIESEPGLTLKFVEPYTDPVRIWIGQDGYGQAQIEGKLLTFLIRKADLEQKDRSPQDLNWAAMPREE